MKTSPFLRFRGAPEGVIPDSSTEKRAKLEKNLDHLLEAYEFAEEDVIPKVGAVSEACDWMRAKLCWFWWAQLQLCSRHEMDGQQLERVSEIRPQDAWIFQVSGFVHATHSKHV